MRKSRVQKAGKDVRLCRNTGEPAHRNMQLFASQLRDTLSNVTERDPARNTPITIRLNQILLAMGYDSSLVEMLGRKFRC